MASDDRFTNNLVLRSVRAEAQRAGCAPSLPEPQPMSDEKEELVLDQMAEVIRAIGDQVDRDPKFKNMVDEFARVMERQSFQRLVDKVFVDGITWGKIVTLICVVGKAITKILAYVSGIVSWTLDYFKDNLLNWICNRGGWINSISSLARYSFEQDFGSSSSLISLSSGVLFISGVLLGGLIVWRLNRGA
ncbi:apoptosis regulator BAX isoform X1 [Rhinichthys klamathensis goyatoka]|uniref:apoptosis regulator BAX isoform X1 n=2 Tax=Rhinichthys klamathensis goyatoka TaxID=3034132 RepID=UPI0024B50577|nr:apoptosis regulator BAX isoform X1 [Rhinichthys klamathensis goyatoka]